MILVIWLALIGAIYSRTDDSEYMKIIYVNCGFSEMNMKAIFVVMYRFEPTTFAIPVECSTNWANKTIEGWSLLTTTQNCVDLLFFNAIFLQFCGWTTKQILSSETKRTFFGVYRHFRNSRGWFCPRFFSFLSLLFDGEFRFSVRKPKVIAMSCHNKETISRN